MTKTIPILAVPIFAAILIGVMMVPAHAGVGVVYCSTDKNNPTTGDQNAQTIELESSGDNCYIDGVFNVYSIRILGANEVKIENTQVDRFVVVQQTTDKVKVKNNTVAESIDVSFNPADHIQVMHNSAREINLNGNDTKHLQLAGNTVPEGNRIFLVGNIVEKFAFCKHNSEDLSGGGNIFLGKNIECTPPAP